MIIHTRITRDPLDPRAILQQVERPSVGAAVLFVGLVRDLNEGRPVSGLRYEAYAPMAEKLLREIAEAAAARVPAERGVPGVAIEHRVGELAVGDASVVIAFASPHRAEAFDGCRYLIEEIKARLPIWKEEQYADGRTEWLDGAAPPQG